MTIDVATDGTIETVHADATPGEYVLREIREGDMTAGDVDEVLEELEVVLDGQSFETVKRAIELFRKEQSEGRNAA